MSKHSPSLGSSLFGGKQTREWRSWELRSSSQEGPLFLFLKAINCPELQGEVLSCDLPASPAVCNWRPGLVLVNLNPEEASDKNPLTQAVGGSEIDCFGATVPACRTSEGATRGAEMALSLKNTQG